MTALNVFCSVRRVVFLGVGAAVLTVATGTLTAWAGPLNPPAGAVTSTGKTLTEVEPRLALNGTNALGDADSVFRIAQPGSYYLTGNIAGVPNRHGIEIAVSNVTIDLNGFTIFGAIAPGAFSGIRSSVAGLTGITVRNGVIRDWTGSGIDFSNFAVSAARVEGVTLVNNTNRGVTLGPSGHVVNCVATTNGIGIEVGIGGTVTGCTVSNSIGTGIVAGSKTLITKSTVTESGSTGIILGLAGSVTECVVSGSGADGILASTGAMITASSVADSAGTGINAGVGSTISNCNLWGNENHGIDTDDGSLILGNTVRTSSIDGIRVSASCLVKDNVVTGSGAAGIGAGIRATGTGNHIEGNTSSGADRGYSIDGASNVIIRNTARGNGVNWLFVANNFFGPIIDRTASASAVVNGSSSPTNTLGSTDPHANFSH